MLAGLQAEISANEDVRKDVQARVDRLVGSSNHSSSFLSLMSTFRLQVRPDCRE